MCILRCGTLCLVVFFGALGSVWGFVHGTNKQLVDQGKRRKRLEQLTPKRYPNLGVFVNPQEGGVLVGKEEPTKERVSKKDTPKNLPLGMGVSLWEALSVVSQKWIPFPTALHPSELVVYTVSWFQRRRNGFPGVDVAMKFNGEPPAKWLLDMLFHVHRRVPHYFPRPYGRIGVWKGCALKKCHTCFGHSCFAPQLKKCVVFFFFFWSIASEPGTREREREREIERERARERERETERAREREREGEREGETLSLTVALMVIHPFKVIG